MLRGALFLLALAVASGQQGQPGYNPNGAQKDPSVRTGIPQVSFTGESERRGTLFGRVLFSDGSSPSQRVLVQRVCGASVTQQTYTDSGGHFSLQTGMGAANRTVTGDASVGDSHVAGSGDGGRGNSVDGGARDCELSASLAGYRSDSVSLASIRAIDNSNVGNLILHPFGHVAGLTVSATTALAPKDARKSYEKGLEALRRNHPDEAQKDFVSAVTRYPRFAAAWTNLGRVYERRDHWAQARDCYAQAIAADPNYLFPYERLYLLDVRESKWNEAAETSQKVLRLNPYDFSGAYYINALANLKLRNLEASEKSAREAARLEGAQVEPRARYLLGVVLEQKGDFAGAAENLRTFLEGTPSAADQVAAKRLLAYVERRVRAGQQ